MAIEVEELRRVRFLDPLSDREIKKLAKSMREHRASPGENLVTEGHHAVAFFVILEGTATVIVHGEEIRTLGPGDHFGEVALVLPDRAHGRTATVRADTEVRLGAMAEWNFKAFIAHNPEVTWPLLITMAEQLAEAIDRAR
jgi:CRP-like cAMP-binding protein